MGKTETSAQTTSASSEESQATESFRVTPPGITLPKGGGAVRDIGEKFTANPVTGSGSLTIPINTSPGRSGFGPKLSLSYDSSAGNGVFGFGWSLSLPTITRKTDKGLPQYLDAEESDVYILSDAEDLVPVFKQDANEDWVRDSEGNYIFAEQERDRFLVRSYRPRTEGLFARIERWTNLDTGESHWRSITRDNITTVYGQDNNSRIFDPADPDPDHPTRIFSWLICKTYDDKGNALIYEYSAENDANINVAQANERNRVRSANRYLKRIKYGNRVSHLIQPDLSDAEWMFEVVFDYDENHIYNETLNDEQQVFVDASPTSTASWLARLDPFSRYRAGFEIRTYRLCQRILLFHHIPDLPTDEPGYDGLVSSIDFTYSSEQKPTSARNPVYTFLSEVTQSGYTKTTSGYLKRSVPPLQFEYSQPIVQDLVEEIDPENLSNLPIGVDGTAYQWIDLHGEGIPGILTEQAGTWFYKRNLSPMNGQPNGDAHSTTARFAPTEVVVSTPNLSLAGGGQFMDLAGDGQLDLVVLGGPMPGLYEHDDGEGWQSFRSFTSLLNRTMQDPNLRMVDLDGDGHTDVLITEENVFLWHPSLAEDGFGPARRVAQALDEEKGPRLILADSSQSIYLADLSGDGLADLIRIRNGEVCYWPNMGYGRFGAKVTMDNAPHFDHPDHFDQKRIRLADIDGSGTTDIIYLHRAGVCLYFNQSGNSWSEPQCLSVFPRVDELVNIVPTDLLGNGTTCLVWSSPLPGDSMRPMRYVNLMGGEKPHLLIKTVNNLGAETRVQYAPSTKFYLQDKADGVPWITRLPFPVHVVERVETYDWIGRNYFVTSYVYHHGYFDGEEREFRGFGMVEQLDSETFAALTESQKFPASENIKPDSHVPPVHTKTWFHTGAYLDREHISNHFEGEYFQEPGLDSQQLEAQFLPDTMLPANLTDQEQREACRVLKGMMLRKEVYADDAPPGSPPAIIQRASIPYTVLEQNFSVRMVQPCGDNRHAVFFTHPRETITFHYERKLAPTLNGQFVDEETAAANPDVIWRTDPRIQHSLTLEVDKYSNILRSIAVGYPRADVPEREPEQNETHLMLTVNRFLNRDDQSDWRHIGVPVEVRTYEVVKPPTATGCFAWEDLDALVTTLIPSSQIEPAASKTIPYEEWDWRTQWNPQTEPGGLVNTRLRLIEHLRTHYRPDDLGAAANDPLTLLPLGTVESLALAGESYKRAFTPGLLAGVFLRDDLPLMDNSADVLGGQGPDQGGYIDLDGDGHWWIPSGRVFYDLDPDASSTEELAAAVDHFFLPRRFRDPFGSDSSVEYDGSTAPGQPRHDLMATRVADALNNAVSAQNDYRVLRPWLVTDPNGNRSQAAFDALGMVAGTAVMGKLDSAEGDTLEGFDPDLTQAQIDTFFAAQDPHMPAPGILMSATTRIIYDLDRFYRTRLADPDDSSQWLPACAATLSRETHASDPLPPQGLKIHISFSYSDGFNHEIQKKIQAEPGTVIEGEAAVSPRWVASGWLIFNNKGKPVRKFEPFFTAAHSFEFGVQVGVSPILFYDPVERVVATLHANHTYDKVVFDPWQQTTWDANDTVLGDVRTDTDIAAYVQEYFKTQPTNWQTWNGERQSGAKGAQEQLAANKAAAHANTPTTTYFDTLGRPFLTVMHNRFERNGTTTDEKYNTRTTLDVEGNPREVIDPQERVVVRYDYDMLGNRIHQSSMDSAERWMLNDVTGKPIRAWDSRGFTFRTEYDVLRRSIRSFVQGADPQNLEKEILFGRTEYGENQPNDVQLNLRTRVFRQYDGAGIVTNNGLVAGSNLERAYDFKGNLLCSQLQLASDYKVRPDWSSNPSLNSETFTTSTVFDALNRPVTITTPDQSVIHPIYNEANLLNAVDVNLRAEQVNGQPKWTAFVTNIDYNAKGQRLLIEYGNAVKTTYEYDPLTFRLIHLLTQRSPVSFPGDCPDPPPDGWPGCQVQNLSYVYDPVGNITHIRDDAQQTIYFDNKRVEPSNDYTYDAIYRLISASGREHIGQTANELPDYRPELKLHYDFNDSTRRNLHHPQDGQAMRTYTELYDYDSLGNIMTMIHQANGGNWTRHYTYAADSNHLLSTSLPGDPANGPYSAKYEHDLHGNMTKMPHLSLMQWDFENQLQATSRQVVNDGGTPEITYYVYDAAGRRVRKVTELSTGQTKDERIYLGGFEVYRQYTGTNAGLVRETLHVMDDTKCIALVETRNDVDDGSPKQLIRYQFPNHLGSASLELDDHAQIISYEEYTPYGSTSYQAARSATETPNRYRYTGKERDEETGLFYYGARYYASWLGRWTAADPIGIADGLNLYLYVSANPIKMTDPSGTDGYTIPASPEDAAKYYNNDCILATGGPGLLCQAPPSSLPSISSPGIVPGQQSAKPTPKPKSKPQPKNEPKGRDLSASELTDIVESLQPRLRYPKPVRQFFGAVGFVGGSLEAGIGGVGGLLTAETGVGAAAGGFLLYHGVDTASSNWTLMMTGEESKTWTYRLGTFTASQFTNDTKLANAIGYSFDMTANLGAGALSLQQIATMKPSIPYNPEFTIPETIAAPTQWKSGFPGIQIGESGGYWFKQVNPESNMFLRFWGEQTIKAQANGLARLGDMATPFELRNGLLITQDVGETMGGSFRLLNPASRSAYWAGSRRMGTFFNDIQPRNMGANGKIFDPAIDPFTKGMTYSLGAGAVVGPSIGAAQF